MRTAAYKMPALWAFSVVCLWSATLPASETAPEGALWVRPNNIIAASGPPYGTTGQSVGGHRDQYGAAHVIDGNPSTFCCLLDDTPDTDQGDPHAIPPGGARPVTGHIVFDLGRAMEVVAVRLTARDSPGVYNPSNIDLVYLTEGDADLPSSGDALWCQEGTGTLATDYELPRLSNGDAYVVGCRPARARYIGLRVNDSYEAGPVHFNFQLAGFEVAVRPTEDDRSWLGEKVHSRELSELARQVESLRRAIEFLGIEYPEGYPGTALLRILGEFEQEVGQAAEQPYSSRAAVLPNLAERLDQLRYRALVDENPLLASGRIVFVKRNTYQTGWYYSEFMQAGSPGGNLCILDLATGEVTELCPQLSGGIFDRFDLSFDAERLVFGHRPAPGRAFRLYEVGVDGRGLRQLTFDPPDEAQRLASYGLDPTRNELGPYRGHTDDFHPAYLPDGGVVFASTRCERGVLCDAADNLSVNVLYRIDGDGGNLTELSSNALSESTPSVMNDGRILYTRWEYVYKGVIAVQPLWAMRPDGSGSTEIYGNRHVYPPVLIHGRAVPGANDLFVATCTMHHPFAVGPILLVDTSRDIRTHAPLTNLTPYVDVTYEGPGGFPTGEAFVHYRDGQWVRDNNGPLFCDPWPLSDKFFLVAHNPDKPHNHPTAYGIWLIDAFGNRVRIYDDPDISCWQPVPLQARPKPPILSPVRDLSGAAGGQEGVEGEATVLLTDVYRGLEGVRRGEVKYLRILEQVPRPWAARRFWPDDITCGQNAVVSLGAHIFVTVLHGVVPVEEDGSAHFAVPAGRSVFFQAIDEDYMEVERMRTFVTFQAGEVRGCIGCHEPRNEAPPAKPPLAMFRAPDRPVRQPGDESVPRPLHYPTDVQPIFDRHCIGCHGGANPEADLVLSGELTTFFNRSYEEIMGRKLIAYIQEFEGADPEAQKGNVTPLGPKALGSHASPLIAALREGHEQVALSQAEWVRLATWVDANGPYYGCYFGRRNLKYRDLPDFRPVPALESAWEVPSENENHAP